MSHDFQRKLGHALRVGPACTISSLALSERKYVNLPTVKRAAQQKQFDEESLQTKTNTCPTSVGHVSISEK